MCEIFNPIRYVPAPGAHYATVAEHHRSPHEALRLEDIVVANLERGRAATHFEDVVVSDNHHGYNAIIDLWYIWRTLFT